jgi:hypothetical protein
LLSWEQISPPKVEIWAEVKEREKWEFAAKVAHVVVAAAVAEGVAVKLYLCRKPVSYSFSMAKPWMAGREPIVGRLRKVQS